jgi:hypothetical protein
MQEKNNNQKTNNKDAAVTAAFLVYKWHTGFLAAGQYVVPAKGWDPSDRSGIG